MEAGPPEEEARYASWLATDITRSVLRPLADLGALDLDPEKPLVRATPLGLWGIRRLLRIRTGETPPLVGDLAAAAGSAEELLVLAQAGDLGPNELREEVRRYREARGPEAAAEFAGLLAAGGPRVTAVLAALAALDPREVEPPLREALRFASAPARFQVQAWLAGQGFDPGAVDATPFHAAEVTAWTLVAVTRADGAEGVGEVLAAVGDERAQADVVDLIGRTGSPFAEEALVAIAAGHGSREVRKAARRALHRVKTGGRR